MSIDTHAQAAAKAAITAAPALAPGAVTIAAEWAGLINTTLSIVLLSLSIAFLIWRWRVAYAKEK
jgi:hypothetical protein